ncbi:DUF4360 domain-containing protein [Leucothrix sargassi]|nr:DUF4360 domain-containing protein [Leucothrix sargassi]
MKNIVLSIAALGCLFSSVGVSAMGPHVKLTNIKYVGNGCPKGSVSVSMTPNKSAINSVFDSYFATFSGKPNQQVRRCKLSVQIHLPKNKRARLRQVRFRGFVDLPVNAHARIERNYRFGDDIKRVSSSWNGKSFQVINQREPFNTTWSGCGSMIQLEVDSMLELVSKAKGESSVGVDSFDRLITRDYRGERGWKFILDYTPC